MALINALGRSLGRRVVSPKTAALTAGAAAAAGVTGFAKGFNSTSGGISSGMYEMLTGDPEIDQYVFGTDVGLRELMLPLPFANDYVPGVPRTAQDLIRNRRFLNSTMISRHGTASRNGYYDNRMPSIHGSVVFGLHNSSMGG